MLPMPRSCFASLWEQVVALVVVDDCRLGAWFKAGLFPYSWFIGQIFFQFQYNATSFFLAMFSRGIIPYLFAGDVWVVPVELVMGIGCW